MNSVIQERLKALRKLLQENGIAAVIVPQADPHISEYLASHWQLRRWLSGFSGSAGDLVVTTTTAALWTDSRYFLQAAAQLEGTGIELMKDGLSDTPSICEWLCGKLQADDTVGVDGLLIPWPRLQGLTNGLATRGISVKCDFDPAQIWKDRPAMPDGKIFIHEVEYAGETATSKISRILEKVAEDGAYSTFISALDDIAWTLNIRCDDVLYTPVASSFLYLSPQKNILFIDAVKVDAVVQKYLDGISVCCKPYGDVLDFLHSLPAEEKVQVETGRTAGAVMEALGTRAVGTSLSAAGEFKSVKNDVQLNGIRNVMVRDGVAMVRSLMEIEQRMATGIKTTELDIADILVKYRSRGANYVGESFGTIAGYGPHGAIVHYAADKDSNSVLRNEGLLLIDSGAQYLDGTTDITRTIALGVPTKQEKRDFTLVLKGHIALATMLFPDDTCGAQLDAIARQYLWRNCLSYLHGTGHGVGHFLGVHEGPQSIRLNYVPARLRPGMVTSNEPGLYRSGIHGIRCENLVLCRRACSNEFGNFLRFETLTLCPFDTTLLDTAIMTADEIRWVNEYHARVCTMLTPYLTDEEAGWLKEHTEEIHA